MRALIKDREPSALDYYRDEIGRYRNLTEQEERELAERIKNGDRAAIEKLINHNLRLVVSIAKEKKYQGLGIELIDLIGAGNEGLIKAAKHFNPDEGRFTTYATWLIKQAVIRVIENESRTIRLPSYVAKEVRAIKFAHTRYLNEFGAEPSIDKVAEITGITVDRILEIDTACGVISLDKSRVDGRDEDDEACVLDMLFVSDDPGSRIEKLEVREDVSNALSHLEDRERKVVEMRFGLRDGKARSLVEVGREFGVTRERIRQIEAKALRKLYNTDSLRQLCDGPIEETEGEQYNRSQKAAQTKLRMRAKYRTKKRAWD